MPGASGQVEAHAHVVGTRTRRVSWERFSTQRRRPSGGAVQGPRDCGQMRPTAIGIESDPRDDAVDLVRSNDREGLWPTTPLRVDVGVADVPNLIRTRTWLGTTSCRSKVFGSRGFPAAAQPGALMPKRCSGHFGKGGGVAGRSVLRWCLTVHAHPPHDHLWDGTAGVRGSVCWPGFGGFGTFRAVRHPASTTVCR